MSYDHKCSATFFYGSQCIKWAACSNQSLISRDSLNKMNNWLINSNLYSLTTCEQYSPLVLPEWLLELDEHETQIHQFSHEARSCAAA